MTTPCHSCARCKEKDALITLDQYSEYGKLIRFKWGIPYIWIADIPLCEDCIKELFGKLLDGLKEEK